ncbi:15248_t:CDS:2, partial [Cetraspora pellucida]
IDNALNNGQDIDGHILKEKARFFADHFLINDFHYSNEDESASVPPPKEIERDQLVLQNLLQFYNLEDI